MSIKNYLFKFVLIKMLLLLYLPLEVCASTSLSADNINPSKRVIFDGKSLGTLLKPYEGNGKFANYAKFENATLLVNVPQGHGWGEIGIESNDTIIDLNATRPLLSHHFKFNFDSNNTTGFTIKLEGINNDKSHAYSNTVVVYNQIDENSSVLELHKDQALHTKLEMNATAPKSMELIIEPSGFGYLNLPDGRYLQTTSIKYPLPSKGYKLRISTKAKKYQSSAKMTLKSIELQKLPFKKHLDLSNLGTTEGKIVLFDGKYFNDVWIPYNEQYKDYFRSYTYFNKKGFIVDVPKENTWGEAGILSKKPAIWLDGLDKQSEINTTFNFDSNHTTGFSIVMGDINHHWKSPSNKNVNLTWTKVKGKNVSKLSLKIDGKVVLDENSTGISPSRVIFTFKHEEISVTGDTFGKKIFHWSHIVANRALHLFVFSHANEKNLPVKMALNEIVLDRKPYQPIVSPTLAEGVDPLPIKEILGTDEKEKSTIIVLDKRRINEATLKIVLQFNPATTDNLNIKLGYLHLFLEKSDHGMYTFRLGDHLARSVEGEWLKKTWNGRINIFLSKNSTEAELDGSMAIEIPEKPSLEFPLQISTSPQKITTQWTAPEGMTATTRWNFLNDENFNPDEFLKELKEAK